MRWGKVAEAIGRSQGAVICRLQKITDAKAAKPKAASKGMEDSMCCKRPFPSSWIGERLCQPCKTYAAESRSQYD